jgi:hypothetical protein
MVCVPKGFVDLVLWPEFSDRNNALAACLHEVTLRVIREEVYSDTSDAQEMPEALLPTEPQTLWLRPPPLIHRCGHLRECERRLFRFRSPAHHSQSAAALVSQA